MAIIVNNLQISGTSTNRNYIQGDFIQSGSTTPMNFNYINIKNSTVSGGLAPGWYALTDNGNIDSGGNTGWIFTTLVSDAGEFFLFFDVNTLV